MKYLSLFFFLFHSLNSLPYYKTPRIDIAPGHLCSVEDRHFQKYRYEEQIPYCKRRVSANQKKRICALYGVHTQEERRKSYTVDHIIPLSIGGSNNDKNLWCQHKDIHSGDFEFEVYLQMKRGKIRQAEALLQVLSYKYNPKTQFLLPLESDFLEEPQEL